MKKNRLFRLILVLAVCVALLSGCSRLAGIKLPPLPTPGANGASVDEPKTEIDDSTKILETPAPETTPEPSPEPTPEPTPEPAPEPTPEPTPDNPNKPHLTLYDETLPEDMPQYSVADLLGEIVTDQGLIIQVEGLITDLDGAIVQRCVYYPYEDYFNLADSVNAELRFGVLQPGKYLYQLKVIAENHSYYTDETLINHQFEVFFP